MIIAATAVSMDAARIYTEVEQQTTGLKQANGATATTLFNDFNSRLSHLISTTTATSLQTESIINSTGALENGRQAENQGLLANSSTVLSQLTEQILGQPVELGQLRQEPRPLLPFQMGNASGRGFQVRRAELVSHSIYVQQEQVMVSASGSVQTADGRQISFSLGLEMQRQSVSVQSTSLGMAPVFIDPIVLNFDGNQPFMNDASFLFDLDGDGVEDEIGCPGSGCGFLAFDRNEDGNINNGLELFGPSSGSGFGELAEFDSDANRWIDENDPIFDKLKVWMKDESGEDRLISLVEAGVGAISITNVGSDFTLESSTGTVVGQVKASGIYLTEDGEVRSIQEIDLATPGQRTNYFVAQGEDEIDETGDALAAMRSIIDMQRFQLNMMLARNRLNQGRDNNLARMERVFDQMWERSEEHLASFFAPRLGEPQPAGESQPDETSFSVEEPQPVKDEGQLAMDQQPESEQAFEFEEESSTDTGLPG